MELALWAQLCGEASAAELAAFLGGGGGAELLLPRAAD